jgi:hypothetical protein
MPKKNAARSRAGTISSNARHKHRLEPAAQSSRQPAHLEFWNRFKGTLPDRIGDVELSTLNAAFGFLFGRLREARTQFDHEDNGRPGAFTALGAFWMFITLFRAPYQEELQVPILRLQDALAGLDENRVDPIVKPSPRRGRAPSSHAYASMKGHAAATVQRLLQTGMARDDAHKQVAKELSKLAVRVERGSGIVTSTTVRNWCDEISGDVGRHGTATRMYDSVLAPAEQEKFSALQKDQARRFALQSLTAWTRAVFPQPQKPT